MGAHEELKKLWKKLGFKGHVKNFSSQPLWVLETGTGKPLAHLLGASMTRLMLLPPTLCLLFMTATVFNKIRFHYGWSDAVLRTAMAPLAGTLWAEGFSETRFAAVRIGMSSQEVKALLGPPLKELCGPENCAWRYSWQDTPTADYDQRSISFDASWRVTELRHRFYID
jgi:hypothetical protein